VFRWSGSFSCPAVEEVRLLRSLSPMLHGSGIAAARNRLMRDLEQRAGCAVNRDH
jgi:hypothetical protein